MLLRLLCCNTSFTTSARTFYSIGRSIAVSQPGTFTRRYASNKKSTEELNVSHSQFLHGAGPRANWNPKEDESLKPSEDELEGVKDGMGKILPTTSHLFKLILPLTALKKTPNDPALPSQPSFPIVILLHPSQPLSHVSRLITSSLRTADKSTPPEISFQSSPDRDRSAYEWSDSTDVGDFIRDAARAAEFTIAFRYPLAEVEDTNQEKDTTKTIRVRVPTFADRTVFLRRRLSIIKAQLTSMDEIKRDCDHAAHAGARRMALSGFGMLVAYWATVARLTFWDFGWDVMEPITYLSGLSTVLCGYLWFLYQGREVSYSSVLDRSISTRRQSLYQAKGFDIDKWADLIAEKKMLVKEIGRIAEDYDQSDEGKTDAERDAAASEKEAKKEQATQ